MLPLSMNFKLKVIDKDFFVSISFTNQTKTIKYLQPDFCPVQVIDESNGNILKDISMKIKRPDYRIEEYEKLLPHQELIHEYNLNERFKFSDIPKKYLIKLYTGYYDPLTDEGIEGEIKKISFIYSKLSNTLEIS